MVALAYDRLCTFEFGCTVELFALERPELDVDWYDFAVCAIEAGPIRAAGGIVIAGAARACPCWRRPTPSSFPAGATPTKRRRQPCWRSCAPPTRAAPVSVRSVRACSCWPRPACSTASAPPPTGATPSGCAQRYPAIDGPAGRPVRRQRPADHLGRLGGRAGHAAAPGAARLRRPRRQPGGAAAGGGAAPRRRARPSICRGPWRTTSGAA